MLHVKIALSLFTIMSQKYKECPKKSVIPTKFYRLTLMLKNNLKMTNPTNIIKFPSELLIKLCTTANNFIGYAISLTKCPPEYFAKILREKEKKKKGKERMRVNICGWSDGRYSWNPDLKRFSLLSDFSVHGKGKEKQRRRTGLGKR